MWYVNLKRRAQRRHDGDYDSRKRFNEQCDRITTYAIVFSSFSVRKAPPGFQKVFRQQENKKPVFLIPSGLKNVFEKFHFRDGLVWTVGLKKN